MTQNSDACFTRNGVRPAVQILRLLVCEVIVSGRFYVRLAMALIFSLLVLQALKWWPVGTALIIMVIGVGNALFIIHKPRPTIDDYIADRDLLTNTAVAIVMIFVLMLLVGFDPGWRNVGGILIRPSQ